MYQVVAILVIAVLTVLDRVSKIAVVNTIKVTGPKVIIPGVISFTYTENTGAAFSSFSDNTAVLIVFTSLVIFLCLFMILTKRVKSKFAAASLILIVSGGIGNMIDRVMNHFVVDFIEPLFVNFAIFNVADIFVTVGAFMLIGYEFYDLVQEKKAEKAKKKND